MSWLIFHRSAAEKYDRGSFNCKDKKPIIRCPSNHSLVNEKGFDDNEHGREKDNTLRHYHPRKHCTKDEELFTNSRSIRFDIDGEAI